MTLKQIADAVNATFVCCKPEEERKIDYAFAADLMSDVLTLTQEHVLFITGLVAPQTIRTAVVSDIHTILVVRNKPVPPAIVELAIDNDICMLSSPFSMYRVSGELYRAGLPPVY